VPAPAQADAGLAGAGALPAPVPGYASLRTPPLSRPHRRQHKPLLRTGCPARRSGRPTQPTAQGPAGRHGSTPPPAGRHPSSNTGAPGPSPSAGNGAPSQGPAPVPGQACRRKPHRHTQAAAAARLRNPQRLAPAAAQAPPLQAPAAARGKAAAPAPEGRHKGRRERREGPAAPAHPPPAAALQGKQPSGQGQSSREGSRAMKRQQGAGEGQEDKTGGQQTVQRDTQPQGVQAKPSVPTTTLAPAAASVPPSAPAPARRGPRCTSGCAAGKCRCCYPSSRGCTRARACSCSCHSTSSCACHSDCWCTRGHPSDACSASTPGMVPASTPPAAPPTVAAAPPVAPGVPPPPVAAGAPGPVAVSVPGAHAPAAGTPGVGLGASPVAVPEPAQGKVPELPQQAAPVVHLAPPVHPQLTAAQLDAPVPSPPGTPAEAAPSAQPQPAGAGQVAPRCTRRQRRLLSSSLPWLPLWRPGHPQASGPPPQQGTGAGTEAALAGGVPAVHTGPLEAAPGQGRRGERLMRRRWVHQGQAQDGQPGGKAPGEEVRGEAQGTPANVPGSQPPQSEEVTGSSGVVGGSVGGEAVTGAPSVALAPPVAAELGTGGMSEAGGATPEAPPEAGESGGRVGPAGVQPSEASGEPS